MPKIRSTTCVENYSDAIEYDLAGVEYIGSDYEQSCPRVVLLLLHVSNKCALHARWSFTIVYDPINGTRLFEIKLDKKRQTAIYVSVFLAICRKTEVSISVN